MPTDARSLYLISDPPPTASNAPQIRDIIADRLQKRHQPSATRSFHLEHRLLRSTPPGEHAYIQILEAPHLSPLPFALCRGTIITAAPDFAGLLKAKLGALWQHRQTIKCEGHAYDVHDFRVRVGRLVLADQARGVVVEVEYLPLDSMKGVADTVLRAFVDGLDLDFESGRWVLGVEQEEEWGVLDTGRLYCELLRNR